MYYSTDEFAGHLKVLGAQADLQFRWCCLDNLLACFAAELSEIGGLDKKEREEPEVMKRASTLRKMCVMVHEEKIKLVIAGFRL